MKRLSRAGLFVFLFSALFACQNKSTLQSKELSLYSFSAYIPPKLLEQFTASTGVKVNLHEYTNNEEMLASLTKNPSAYDIIIPTDYAVDKLVKTNALLPLDFKQIPNSKNIDPSFLAPYFDPGGASGGRGAFQNKGEKYSLPFQWGTTGILYDPQKIKTAITSWTDLWRPELLGHVVTLDDPREMLGLTLLSLGYAKNSTNATQLEAAKTKLAELAKSIVGYDSATPENYLLNGKAWAGVVFSGNATLAKRKNPALEYVFPKEGAGIWFDSMVIPKASMHPDAAQAFINFVLDPSQSILITEMFPYSNPNRAALALLEKQNPSLYTAYTNSPISNPGFEVMNNAKAIKNVGTFSATYESIWKNIKGSK